MKSNSLARTIFVACLLLADSGVAMARDPHRIGPGDVLRLRYGADEVVVDEMVDLDGGVSAPRLGRIMLDGMTLDEATAAIGARSSELDLYRDGDVTLGVVAYAPVLVGGDVRRPGPATFMPGMTVGAAVALAGGVSASGMAAEEIVLLSVDLEARATALAIEADRLALRAARLEAAAAGASAMDVPSRTRARERLGEDAVAREMAILSAEREGYLQVRATLESGVAEADSRIALFGERIGVQQRIVALQNAELEQTRALIARGVRPENELMRYERQYTEAQARLLEVEAAVADARARRIDLSGDLARLDSARRQRIADDAAETAAARVTNRFERAAVARKRAMLGVGATEDATFALTRRGETRRVAGDEPLQPGDILTVTLEMDGASTAVVLESGE